MLRAPWLTDEMPVAPAEAIDFSHSGGTIFQPGGAAELGVISFIVSLSCFAANSIHYNACRVDSKRSKRTTSRHWSRHCFPLHGKLVVGRYRDRRIKLSCDETHEFQITNQSKWRTSLGGGGCAACTSIKSRATRYDGSINTNQLQVERLACTVPGDLAAVSAAFRCRLPLIDFHLHGLSRVLGTGM